MKNTTTKLMWILSLLLVVGGLIVADITRTSFRSVGLEKIEHTDDLGKYEILVDYAWGQNDSKATIEDLIENRNLYIDNLKNADLVLIVEATGSLTQYNGSYAQTAKVSDIVVSSLNYLNKDDLLTIYQYGGFVEEDGKIKFTETTNNLYPGQKYLVFLDESDLNQISGGMDFYFYDSIFSCVKLTDRDKQEPCDLNFNESKETVQFCATDEVLAAFEGIEEALIDKYVYENAGK